ncbi:MAG: GNAT family N-acetyltransferase [DPANN group archaeon]|nr:GNAT family N-acetyltransferase [DPANN group archaeon]
MIRSDRLVLRPLEEKDAKDVVAAINFREIARYTRIPFPYTLTDAKNFIGRQEKEALEKRSFAFGIFLREKESLIGGIGIHNINWEDGRGDFGYWLTPAEQGKGYAREAAYALLRHLFYDLQLNRVEIETIPSNRASQRLAQWLGAEKEGFLRKRCCAQEEQQDVFLFGLLGSDFERLDHEGRYRREDRTKKI